MATILIVDDHAINRQFLLTLLGYGGHRLLEAADGITALAIARSEVPTLVITDILMPNMDGYEFVTHMRADVALEKIPVIFYTASYREREARSMAQACGVQWVLSKPSDPELIIETVQQAIGLAQTAASLPGASDVSRPQLSASLEADKFSLIEQQLRASLAELGTVADPATALSAQHRQLQQIGQQLSASMHSLQAVSLRLTRLVELGLDLAAERDPARMLEILCRAAHGICGARYAATAVLDHDNLKLGYCFTRGIDNHVVAQLRALPPGVGVLGRLIRDRIPIRSTSVGGDPQQLGLPSAHPPVHSFLGVSLSSKERTYGWLYVADKIGAAEFSDVDEQLAATIAAQLAAAYENLILYDEVNQHRSQLQMEVVERKQAQETLRRTLRARTVMAECNRVLVHAIDEYALLNEMCQTIVGTGGFPMVWIGYGGEDINTPIKVVAQAGEMPGYLDQPLQPRRASVQIRNRRPLLPHVGNGAQAASSPAAHAFNEWEKLVAGQGFRSTLSLPLMDGRKIFGALTLYEHEAGAFRSEQIELLQELAADIAYGALSLRNRRARELAEQSLLATQEKLTGILNSIDNIVWSLSEKEILYISPVAEKVYGRPLQEFYENKNLLFDLIHPLDRQQVHDSFHTLLEHGAATREYRILRADGDIRWLEDRTKAVYDLDRKLLRFDGVASDITERKEYEARIEYLATHDPLTGLANRNLLRDRLSQAIASAKRSAHLLALLFVDLDRFKGINDSFGHDVGDALLMAVASRLRHAVREGDTVARPGGDEFIVLLAGFTDTGSVTSVANELLRAFATPFVIKDIELHVTASIGISVYPNDGTDIESLLRNTDTAMYRSKEQGGHSFQFYSSDMSVRAIERMELETALHHALERQEFELFYQPIVNLASGQIVSAEALIRWRHPQLGLVPPARFMPIAEEIGLITPIGEWVLKTACAQNKAWQMAGHRAVTVSVNLSSRQFRHEEIVNSISTVLADTGLDAHCLELELTESLVMDNAGYFINKLQELNALGVQLSIDDFGTGYSSLSYLKRFPLDRLKIDRSFVNDIVTDADDAAITRSVISLGHSLSLKVVAEGVESAEQIAFLRAHDCDEIQGDYFSPAVSGDAFRELLQSGRTL